MGTRDFPQQRIDSQLRRLKMATNSRYEDAARDILSTFAQYGFRKTSMEDIARAAGVSRHSIYKKFGSKEKCYESTIHAYLSDMYSRIFSALSDHNVPPLTTLLNVFDIFMGEGVDLVRNAHGPEVLDDVFRAAHAAEEDWPLRFRTRVGEFLQRHDIASADTAFVLISASKGLVIEEPSREQFLEDMKLIIESVAYRDTTIASRRLEGSGR